VAQGRRVYVHVIKGRVEVNGEPLGGGDAIKLTREGRVVLEKGQGAEVLLFDLP